MISVDKVIATNLPQLTNSFKIKKLVKKSLSYLLHEQEFTNFATTYPHLQGIEFVEQVLDELDFDTRYKAKQIENIPSEGKIVIIANHPIGSLDALALINVLSTVRADLKVVANRMLMTVDAMHSLLLPVDNLSGQSKKQELSNIHQHLKNEGALLIFPAGEVSRLRPTGIKDCKWNSGFLRIAKKANSPILPIHIKARNSPLFYGASMLYKPLASLLLVKEMFKQRKSHFPIRIGEIIPVSSYANNKLPIKTTVKLFKKHLYAVANDKPGMLNTQAPIALPESRSVLHNELKTCCELLGQTGDNKFIYLYQHKASTALMREIGRLREIAFRTVGEGTFKKRDIDKYDSHYYHLVLWDNDTLEVVGAYRFADAASLSRTDHDTGLYTSTLFNFTEQMEPFIAQGLELGRSFVQPQYWGKRSLDYLWYGIGAFIRRYPQYRYLFGPVSLSDSYPEEAKQLIVQFYTTYFRSKDPCAIPKQAFLLHPEPNIKFDGNDYKSEFKHLKHILSSMGFSVPTLFKQYTEIANPEGVRFHGFNIDPDFNFCVDGLVMVDIQQLTSKKYARYIEANT